MPRGKSFVVVTAAYVAACGAFVGAARALGHPYAWASVFVGYLAATAVIFVVGELVNNGSAFDPWWSVMPPAAAIWLTAASHGNTARGVLVSALVTVWGVRLTYNWAYGWSGFGHEDWRYTMLYEQAKMPKPAVRLLAVELFPTLIVTLGSWPLAVACIRNTHALGALDVVAAVVTGAAILLEMVADNQRRAFDKVKQAGQVLDRGLWAWSRHPNYLGEIGLWVGLGLFAIAADPRAWFTLAGPLAIIVMFLAASIPMLEKRSAERRPGWAAYRARTSMLLLRPPRRTSEP
jgi:steroid 5-alpha reductase family enzyme